MIPRWICELGVFACLSACAAPATSAPGPQPGGTPPTPASTAPSSQGKRAAGGIPDPFTRDSDMRTALTTLERLRIVKAYREVAPGVLRLTIGDGWNVPSAEYHLGQLYGGYASIIEPGRPVVLELWRGGAKFGEYTADGLLIGPEFSTPR